MTPQGSGASRRTQPRTERPLVGHSAEQIFLTVFNSSITLLEYRSGPDGQKG